MSAGDAGQVPLRDAALWYARHGYPVLPLHSPARGPDGQTCSCNQASCDHPAKHPRTLHGLKDATTDEALIRKWWQLWPDANIGVRTGNGLLALDIDPRAGGDLALLMLCEEHGQLPETPTVLTGGGGQHYWFRAPAGIRVGNSVGVLGPGLDIRADDGYVVAAPSSHISGNPYTWEATARISDVPIADAPQWLINLATRGRGANGGGFRAADHLTYEHEGRNIYLFRMGRSEKARGHIEAVIRAALDAANKAQCVPPVDKDEFERIIQSVLTQADNPEFQHEGARENGAQGETQTWPELQPLPNRLPAVPTFDETLLPGSLRPWLTDIAKRAQAPLDFLAAAAITALSSALGRRYGIYPKRQDDWLVVANLWGMIIGPPGFLKSPMLHEVLKPLVRLEVRGREEYDREQRAFELAKEAAEAERRRLKAEAAKPRPKSETAPNRGKLIEDLRALDGELRQPSRRRYMTNDPSVEKLGELLNQNPDGLLLTRDEISGFLANMDRAGHENDRAFYLQAWNGYSGYIYDRIGRGTIDIEAACVSILGCITPGPLGAYLRETFSGDQDDGLIQRFQLSVYPDPPPGWVNIDRWPNSTAKNDAFALFERFVSFGSEPLGPGDTEIPASRFDDRAQEFFDKWRAELEERVRGADEHPVMVAHLAKYRSLMPSLALIFHLCDSTREIPVSLEAAERAAAWCDYLEAHARRIYHCVVASSDLAARLLGEKIRARKLSSPFTARDVYRPQWTGLTEPDDVTRALEVLEDLAWLACDSSPPPVAGGRPTLRYRINLKVWE
jgi:putative DNA primase/helicase